MADGNVNLSLSDKAAEALAQKAEQIGVSPAHLAKDVMEALLSDPAGSWRPKTTAEDYAGPYHELEDVLAEFNIELDRRLADRTD